MGLFRHSDRVQIEKGARQLRQSAQDRHAWLPGGVEVPVAGESFHVDEINAAQWSSAPSSTLAAVLVPEPGNPHDPHAVAVYLNNRHVGYLPREVAGRVQSTLVAFSGAHEGRHVSCRAEIRTHDVGPQVVLFLDPEPLGVPPEAFQIVPDLDAMICHLIARLDEPAPVFTGESGLARAALATAEDARAETDANYDRRPADWPRVERMFRNVAGQLTAAQDPYVSAAWLGVGRATRYQRGHRDETLHAFIEALYWERGNVDAWRELLDIASAAPHVPTLIGIVARVPFESRPSVLNQLLTMSYGRDRLGNMSHGEGKNLRDELLTLAESQGDTGSIALLAGNAGLVAEKSGDVDTAVTWWRRAVAAGSTDEKVADRLSVWLTKRHAYTEAERVLRQALAIEPQSAEVAQRMRQRLTRCERNLAE